VLVGLLAVRYSDLIVPAQYRPAVPESCRRVSYASDPLSTAQNYFCEWVQRR
jgi:hypothetical protein